MKTWLPVLTGVLILAGPAFADRPAPPVKKDDGAVPLVIQVDMKAQQNKLLIPKEMLGKLKADAGAEPKSLAKLHTMVAGLSLALALAFGGVWMMKHRGQTGGRALALLVGAVTALLIGGAAMVWADVAPRSQPFPVPGPVNSNVIIEVVEKGTEIKLIITRDQLTKLNGGVGIRPVPLPAPVPKPPAPGGIFDAPQTGQAPAILPTQPPQPAPAVPQDR